MKTKSKALLLAVCAVLLVTASVLGTMAYLTSQDEVVNTFTVGAVSIKLDEAKVDQNGVAVKDAPRVDANSYKLIPGQSYTKDPTVTVEKGSEKAYVKMTVTVNKTDKLDAIDFDLMENVEGYNSANWIAKGYTEDEDNNTRTYEFWYKEAVTATSADVKLPALFQKITLPGTITNGELESFKGMTITIQAHAIQAAGFSDATAAWAAYN